MDDDSKYLIPDYYPEFACKMGRCRSACCEGWPISVSMKDYFRLIGVACTPELRSRLDCAMHILENPVPERYAQITPRYDGNCPLRLKDGRCAVQAELGEDALPEICRLYPRGPRAEGDLECSCANSCEAVLELLFRRDEPISFIKKKLDLHPPKPETRTVFFETVGREQEIRLYLIKSMQLRNIPFPERLIAFGYALKAMDEALNSRDEEKVDALLNSQIPLTFPDFIPKDDSARLELGLRAAQAVVELVDERSVSVREYGQAALEYFGHDEGTPGRYRQARDHFEKTIPKWPIYFEHMLVNHMFFERFPFQDRPESLMDEFLALCCVYSLLRFLGIGWMWKKSSLDDFVSACASAFRLIDHTSFDRYAAHILREIGCDDEDSIGNLISL